jgi:hypothetical protein
MRNINFSSKLLHSLNAVKDRVLGLKRVVNRLATTVVGGSVANLDRKLVTRNTELSESARLGLDLCPARSSGRVLDPFDEPIVHGVSKCLLSSGDVGQSCETLISTEKEGDLSAVGGSANNAADDVAVFAEETVGPSALLGAAKVDKVVDRAEEAGISILSTAHSRDRSVVRNVVSSNQLLVRDMGDISIEGVDPRAEVGVLATVDQTENHTLAVGVTGQERNVRSVIASSEATSVVGEASDLVNDRREPRIVGRVEISGLNVVDALSAKAVKLTNTSTTTNVGSDNVKTLVERGDSRTRLSVSAHLDGTDKP